jgi:catechol 2,3-dioxygenase-like lactoylglutathione lyase family enzyme
MLDHVSLGVRDIRRSRHFYDHALRPLGLVRIVDFRNEYTATLEGRAHNACVSAASACAPPRPRKQLASGGWVKNRLSESDERELIRRAKPGDDGARNRLWEAFFPFAMAECRKQAELTNLDPDIAEGEAG